MFITFDYTNKVIDEVVETLGNKKLLFGVYFKTSEDDLAGKSQVCIHVQEKLTGEEMSFLTLRHNAEFVQDDSGKFVTTYMVSRDEFYNIWEKG